jgi:RNA polymerase sigma factor (sigma-70 family)
MLPASDTIQTEVDRLYKLMYGKMVTALLYSSQNIDPETAEDLVQDSFSAALIHWRSEGMPVNAAGWIYRVCKNKALNFLKKQKREKNYADTADESHVLEQRFSESIIDDQTLKVLFACAHPDLSPKVQVVITLKYVVNLKVEAIARILGMTQDGVDKLLLRARQKIRNEKILLQEPEVSALKPRVPTVCKVIYLLFNEGYKASWGKELLREALCEEALILNRQLCESVIATPEALALQALMLFNAARFKSRFGAGGELLDLEEQDRTRWNTGLIYLGTNYLKRARQGEVSAYHYEASIACLHCTAPAFAQTDWQTISNLYQQLLHRSPNPFVEMNYAIALYYAGQKEKAFGLLNTLQQHPFMNQYYLLNATLGKLHLREGRPAEARTYFIKTLEQTQFEAEHCYIQKMLDRCH